MARSSKEIINQTSQTTKYNFSADELVAYLFSRSEPETVNITEQSQGISPENKTLTDCRCCDDIPNGKLCTKHKHLETLRQLRDNDKNHISRAMSSFPPEVELCISSIPGKGYGVRALRTIPGKGYGVRAVRTIPEGTWIGPYEGKQVKPERFTPDIDNSYMWEIYEEGSLAYYLDGSDEDTSSWMRFIRCARYKGEQNTSVMQYFGNIYYRVFKEISPGCEILVWYDDTCPHYLGIPLKMQDIGASTNTHEPKVSNKQPVPVPPRVPQNITTTGNPNNHVNGISRPHPMMTTFVARYPTAVRQPLPRYQVAYPVVSRDTLLHSSFANTSNLRDLNDAYTAAALYGKRSPYMVNGKSKSPSAVVSHKNINNSLISHGIVPYSRDHSKTNQSIRSTDLNQLRSTSVPRDVPQIHNDSIKGDLDQNGNIQTIDNESISYSEKIKVKQASMTSSDNTITKLLSQIEEARLEEMKAKQKALQDIIQDKHSSLQEEGLEINLWKCGQCEKSFAQQQILQLHICSSVPEKPYKCTYCPESFAQPSDLRTHAVCHSGKKPFKCGFCSRLFAGSTTLNNHIRTHTGERPFGCDKCGREFTQASQLSRHRRALFECT